mmetsp:Transcript_20848/g.54191  ORF Transcript_20848/g.54191 Transcript_20848/m.54191 type:complete len:290 (+) Transcript_20848:180-1049(+)
MAAAEAAGDGSTAGDTDPFALSDVERRWCIDLRAALAAQGVPEPQPKSDFLLAQFALIGKGQTAKAVKRVQKFNEVVTGEYNYPGFEEALKLPAYGFSLRKFPGMMQVVPRQTAARAMTMVFDAAPFLPAELMKNEDGFNLLMTDFLVALDALTADLSDIRTGTIMVTQCGGMGMKNYSHKAESKAANVYQDSYPVRYHSLPCVNVNIIFKVIIKLAKLFLSKKLQERIVVCTNAELYEKYGYDKATMPSSVGGDVPVGQSYDEDFKAYDDMIRERLQRRRESIAKVRI